MFNKDTTRITTMCSSQAISWNLETGEKVRFGCVQVCVCELDCIVLCETREALCPNLTHIKEVSVVTGCSSLAISAHTRSHAHSHSHTHSHLHTHTNTHASQIRVFDFVVDKFKMFKSVAHPTHATFCHSSTILFDHESQTAVLDMVSVWFCCVV